jgi:hypothetical protein
MNTTYLQGGTSKEHEQNKPLPVTPQQRAQLQQLAAKRSLKQGHARRVRVALLAAEGVSGVEIARRVGLTKPQVSRTYNGSIAQISKGGKNMLKTIILSACITIIAMVMASDDVLADGPRTEAATECRATIDAVLVYSDGSVNVRHSGRGDFTVICNLKTERLGVNTTTCAMWTAMLQSLKEAGKRADFYYTLDARFTSCANLPTYWDAPAPAYIGTIE